MKINEIAVDIDGTVLNFSNKFSQWRTEQGKPTLNGEVLRLGDEFKFYEKDEFQECFDLHQYPDAHKVLQDLSLKSKLTFLTKRASSSHQIVKEKLETLTIKWQQKDFPFFSGIFFTKNKIEFFKNKMFDLAIEDDGKNAIGIAEYAPVLLLSRSWNRDTPKNKNIIIVEDWNEIEFVLNNFEDFYVSS